MALRRVSAMFMREEDLHAVQDVLSEQSVSGRVVIGTVEEDQVDALRSAGLFIYRVDPESGPPLPTEVAVPPAEPRPSATRGGDRGAESVPAEPQLPAATDVYLVSVAGPLMPSWATELDAAGAELLERVADTAYACRIALGNVGSVSALPFVSDLRLYRAEDTLHSEQLGGAPQRRTRTFSVETRGAPAAEELVSYDLVLHSPDGAETVIEWLGDHGMELVGAVSRKIRFRTERGGPELAQLARLPQVAAIDEWVPPTLSNDRARILLGVEQGDGGLPLKWTGKNQRVAVADSGIDATHPDFDGRLVKIFALGVPGDPRDRHGHGTHVAGSIAGDGPTIKGTAPGAELVFQSIMDANGELSGLPFDLGALFDQAREEGARIHNNSWGALAGGAYRTTSLEVDSYVHEHPDMLVVVAAGNNGTASNPRNAERGFVDLFSVDAPATAKNALTVGASRSDRVWNPPITWAQFDVNRFADSPIGEGLVSGDPTGLAAFSGRGPCAEMVRIKPDVVAPGTFILSTRASTAPDESFWAPKDDRYAYMGGTSMATPLVAGCAAVVREYLITERDHQPSAALMKAMLVNGTRWLDGPDAVADNRFEPNYHQGFGMVDLRTTLPGPGLARLEFADGWQDDASALSFTGDSRTFVVNCSGGVLRLCLAWTDLPGRGLQNSLAMLVANDALGERTSGNPRRKKQFDTDDAGNNVQVIRFDNAAAGSYVIQVTAANLLPRSAGTTAPPQHFALVASGDITSDLTTF